MLMMLTPGPVAYLGFQKRGAKCLLVTSAHTKEGPNQVLHIVYYVKKFFFAKGGLWPIWPKGKYATAQATWPG